MKFTDVLIQVFVSLVIVVFFNRVSVLRRLIGIS